MSIPIISALGDQAVTISLGDGINIDNHKRMMAMKRWLDAHAIQGMVDIVLAYNSLTVIYDFYQVHQHYHTDAVSEMVKSLLWQSFNESITEEHSIPETKKIPVCYNADCGPDLKFISERNKIDVQDIVRIHSSLIYHVYMIGFLPGFAYMGEVDSSIATPRKNKPVPVSAGSVGIAGKQTGIYPVHSPGGWQIIGRTPLPLFSKASDPPVKLEAGDRVQFYEITDKEFLNFTDISR